MLDKQRSSSTIKFYAAAIAAFHAPITGWSVGRNSAVIQFLRGTRRINPPCPRTVPPWDLLTVLMVQRSVYFRHLGGGRLVLAIHICKVLQPGSPCLACQSLFCLSSNLPGSPDLHCSSPSFAWSVHNYMDARYHLRDDTQATDDPPILTGYGRLHSHWLAHHRHALVRFLILHKPIDVQLYRRDWNRQYSRILDTVLVPISQGTEVMIVTEYVFLCSLVLRWCCIVVVVSSVLQCFALGFIIKHSILNYPFTVCFILT